MSLDVKWSVSKTELRFQEDSACKLKLTNTGNAPLTVCNPVMSPGLVELRVLNLKTGKELIYQVPPPPGSIPDDEATLAPGKSFDKGMMLLDLPRALEPGEYDVSAGCRYNDRKERAESAPVRVKVRATTARNLVVAGLQNINLYGAWINLGDEAPEIVRMEFDLSPRGGARDLRPIAKASLHALPVISVPRNREACAHHWIAWTEGSDLKFSHLHETQGASPLKTVPTGAAEIRIAAPLHTDPTPDDNGRPQGGLLLWLGERDKKESQLQSIKLTPDGAAALAKSALPGPKPAWLGSFVRSDSRRLALIAQVSDGKIALSELPWPGTAGALRKLGEWKGEFVGAGITLGGDDALHGLLLLRAGPTQPLERFAFKIDAKGVFQAEAPAKLEPEFRGPLSKSIVRVSGDGAGAALLQDPTGPWSFYDGRKIAALEEPFKTLRPPLDLAFQESGGPLLIVGGKDFGLQVLKPDGSPLRPRI